MPNCAPSDPRCHVFETPLPFGGQKGVKFNQSEREMSAQQLLESVADVLFTLNESHAVQDITGDTGVLRVLPRDALIGRPWQELVRETDKNAAETWQRSRFCYA